MADITNSPFSLDQFHIDEFEIKREPVDSGIPEFDFEPAGYIDYEKNVYILSIGFTAKDSNGAYDIRCHSIGAFRFSPEPENEVNLSSYFYVNAPAIVYPYIRAFIASVTALSGLEAINLPVMNFSSRIGDKLRENTSSSRDEENLAEPAS